MSRNFALSSLTLAAFAAAFGMAACSSDDSTGLSADGGPAHDGTTGTEGGNTPDSSLDVASPDSARDSSTPDTSTDSSGDAADAGDAADVMTQDAGDASDGGSDAGPQDGGSDGGDGGSQKVWHLAARANLSSSGDQLGSSSDFVIGNGIPGTVLGSGGGCTAFKPSGGTPAGGSAGTVTVSGANDGLTFTPNGASPNVIYASSYAGSVTPAFNAGATLTFSAPGGPDIGAFSGQVTGPARIAGYTPPTSISRSAGLSITWTAATSSYMEIDIIATDPSTHSVEWVACQFSDTGSFTIPSSVLSSLGPTYTVGTFVYLQRVNETSLTVGGWTIDLDAVQGDERATNVPIGP